MLRTLSAKSTATCQGARVPTVWRTSYGVFVLGGEGAFHISVNDRRLSNIRLAHDDYFEEKLTWVSH